MKLARYGVTLAAILLSQSALAAPQSLYGKTIRVAWNETRSQRIKGEGEFKSVSVPLSLTVYVGTNGQLFRRHTSTAASGRATGSKDRVGANTSGADGAGVVSFQGNTLVSTTNNGGLGRRIRVSFSDGSSCSAEILTGKAGAGSSSFRSNATGKMMELESVTAGTPSCTIQNGNAFAD